MSSIYYIVLVWSFINGKTNQRLTVHQSEQTACREVSENTSRATIYALAVNRKNCIATSDPEWIQCLVEDGAAEIKEGRCEPKKEFYFAEEKGAKK